MAGDFPKLSKIFVDERDAYMTHVLHSFLIKYMLEKRLSWERTDVDWQPLRVVAVVGVGHTPGIAAYWDNQVDIAPFLHVPPPSTSEESRKICLSSSFLGSCWIPSLPWRSSICEETPLTLSFLSIIVDRSSTSDSFILFCQKPLSDEENTYY